MASWRPTMKRPTSVTVSVPPGRYQCQTAVVEAEHRAGQQPRVALRQQPLLHAAGEERAPGELELARQRAGARAGRLLARQRALHADAPELGDHDAVAEDLLLGEVERVDEHGDERLGPVVVLGSDPLEALAEVR